MNLNALIQNIKHGKKVCSSKGDELERMLWLYSGFPLFKLFRKKYRYISFNYPEPIGKIELTVRDNNGADSFIFGEVFDHEYYKISLPFLPLTILDLGANIGFTAIYLSRYYPNAKIACVEPMPDNLKLLHENINKNKVDAIVFSNAIAVNEGSIIMQIAENDYAHKVKNIKYGKMFNGNDLVVNAITVDNILKKLSWERVSLLKIDIEGYEGILLRENCDWLNQVDSIYIEYHEGFSEEEIIKLAMKWGFTYSQPHMGMCLLLREKT